MPWLMNAVNVSHNWLLSVADFHATERGLDQLARKILFNLIFELPTVSDVVVDEWEDVDEEAMQREGHGKYVMKECGGCSGKDRQEGWVSCGQCKSNHHPGCLSQPGEHHWVKDCPQCAQSSSSAKKKPSKSAKKRKNRN